jgi:NDP-sugar pyrophosphorylase family protein
MIIQQALIMAAGRGMRMMPFTENMPKAMAPLAGTTLIANGIDKLKKRIPNIHITVGYKGSMLASHVIEHDVNSVLNTEGKDNSWWIYNTLMKNLDLPIYVLTCDNVIELDFDLMEKDYVAAGKPACMVIPVKPIEGLDGDFIFHENQRITELSRTKPSEMYCSGIQILNPKKINELTQPADNFYNVWMQLIELNQLYCSNIYPKQWYAVDTVNQLEAINKLHK